MKIEKFEAPFLHYAITDFLNEEDYKKAIDFYNSVKFYEKHIDLFNFYQTNELKENKGLDFFKIRLNEVFKSIQDSIEPENENKDEEDEKNEALNKSWLSIFASYYRKGSYLLCHDDLVENRKFAFSYYLEDFESGELILYDQTATKEVKRVKVVKNFMVIFEVSPISFHEVNYCKLDGRKAFTGWLNIKNHDPSLKTFENNITIKKQEEVECAAGNIDLDVNIDEEDYFYIPNYFYNFTSENKIVEGPFTNRKLMRLQVEDINLIPKIKNLELIEKNNYYFREGDYILLNDKINENEYNKDVYDVFIISDREKSEEEIDMNEEEFLTTKDQKNIISYVNENGEIAFGIEFLKNSMFLVKRGNMKIFIERTDFPFFLAHLIYHKQ